MMDEAPVCAVRARGSRVTRVRAVSDDGRDPGPRRRAPVEGSDDNHQGTFAVDSTYAPRVTADGERNVNPISGGTYEDLIWAKSIDGTGAETVEPIHRNPNFGKTVSRYAPTSAQIGFRLSF